MKTITTDEFITRVGKMARFSKGDVKLILDAVINIFEDAVKNDEEIKLRSFGHLMFKKVKARKIKGYTTKTGETFAEKELPEAERIIFKLAENIKSAKKRAE